MKKILALLYIAQTVINAQTSYNVQLYGHTNAYGQGPTTYSYSEIWGWTDTTKQREYAIIGTPGGTSIVDITDSLQEVAFLMGPPSSANYHEFRTYKNYLYIGSEGTDINKRAGIQIVDLSTLPDSATFKKVFVWDEDGMMFYTAHTVSIEKNFLYVNGGTFGGTRIMDISNPLNPVQVGSYGKGNTPYIHDSFIRNDTLYAAAIFDGRVDIVDMTVKGDYTETTSAKVLSKTPIVPEGWAHQVWLSDDGNYMFVSTEIQGGHLHIYDIRNKTAPVEIATWSSNPTASIHNSFVNGNFIYIAYYSEGLRILDITNPSIPIEVGFYDTFTLPNPPVFSGAWGVYPYFPSGKIAVSDINSGLYVFTFNKKFGGRVTGTVRDGITNAPIENVQVMVQEMGRTYATNSAGKYTYGSAEGTHTIQFSKENYVTRIDTITTRAGMLDTVDIVLYPTGAVSTPVNNTPPLSFSLSQNFPNPFNPVTTIRFELAHAAFTSLSVFNVLGERIASPIRQHMPAGMHSVQFNAAQLPSGVYFYQLTSGAFSETKKMVIAR